MIPSEKELLEFIKKKGNIINFSMIARSFEINNATVSDLIHSLEVKKLVKVTKLGGSKIVSTK